jgi:hypothetical protein
MANDEWRMANGEWQDGNRVFLSAICYQPSAIGHTL